MLFSDLPKYGGSLVKIGTLLAAVPPGITATDGFYTARLIGEVTNARLAVIEADQGMDWATCPYTIHFYLAAPPDRVWVVDSSSIVDVVLCSQTADTNPGYKRWPDKCPLCGSPGKASFNMLECTGINCRNRVK